MTAPVRWSQALASDGRVEFPVSRRRLALILLASVLFVVVGIVLGANAVGAGGAGDRDVVGLVISGACVLFFGLAAVLAVVQLVRGGTPLSVSTDGVTLSEKAGTIPWSAIESVDVVRYQRNRFVQLGLTEEEYDRQVRVNSISTALKGASRAITGGPAVWLPNTIAAKPEDLATWLGEECSRRCATRGTGPA